MRKVALVFTLAVIAPSLVLAWLAVRSLRDQGYALDRQQTLLYQGLADGSARAISRRLDEAQREFEDHVEGLLKGNSAESAAGGFDAALRARWPLAEVGFVATQDGRVLAPSPLAGASARRFRVENDAFLCSVQSCEVYWNSPKGPIRLPGPEAPVSKESATPRPQATTAAEIEAGGGGLDLNPKLSKAERTVIPAKDVSGDAGASKLSSGEINFRKLVGDEGNGAFARFLQDQLHVMFWHRAAGDRRFVFGAQLHPARLVDMLRPLVASPAELEKEICVALLDDRGLPVALSHPGFRPSVPPAEQPYRLLGRPRQRASRYRTLNRVDLSMAFKAAPPQVAVPSRAEWKHPFVAAEIGEILPHWEVAVYLVDPAGLARSANSVGVAFGLLITLLVLAIAVGSWLIVADLRRQLSLARQKTDFVSNVSHELKTPLTSIRMFSEMLAEGRVEDEGKRRQFLGIITSEAARLTRLINNVLDFARLERGEKKYAFESCSARALVRDTVESYRPHLEAQGFRLDLETPGGDITWRADRDAVSQILVNLLSNAEKYSGERKEIEVRLEAGGAQGTVRVLDRGVGVPRGEEERIFEQFHRAHDSLASGVQGSGLGLTLARQIARQHGGDVRFERPEGGGSCFVLELPCASSPET